MSDPTTATTGTSSTANTNILANAQTQVANSKATLGSDLNSFLNLLTAQLQNQDPLSPMDSTQFTNQLTQFAQVEQQIDINSNLTSLIGLSQQSIVSSAVNYIGKTIEGQSDQVPLQNGALKAGYGIEADASQVSIVVRDSNNNIVYNAPGQTAKGVYEFDWNGQDSNGQQEPDGTYTLSITSEDSTGAPVSSYVTAFGQVTGVTNVNGSTVLLLDKVGIPVDNVLSITAAPQTSDATN